MSYINARTYARQCMNVLGYSEWKKGWDLDNCPSTELHKKYHLAHPSTDSVQLNQQALESNFRIVIRVAFKAYREEDTAIDAAIAAQETIVKKLCNVVGRTGLVGVKNVLFEGAELTPFGPTNDNAAILTLSFVCLTVLDVNSLS